MQLNSNKVPQKQLLIVTPLFWGDASGASVYYRLLSEQLTIQGYAVSVISDKEKPEIQPQVNYYSLFPARCGRERRIILDYYSYAAQNVAYLKILGVIAQVNPDLILVHTSFYNRPGIFAQVMERIMRKHPNVDFIADVRDGLMPPNKVPLLNSYFRVIACSDNVRNHLLENGVNRDRIIKIPVLQEKLRVDDDFVERVKSNFGLLGNPYIFFGGLVKENKGIGLLLEAYLNYVLPERNDVRLVIAGLLKTSNKTIKGMLNDNSVLYVGNQRRQVVLALMSGASLCVNLSRNEGMPRTSLEVLALRKPVVLPPNVPEFAKYCKEFVVSETDPRIVAKKMLGIMDARLVPNYPIEEHLPENVINAYCSLLPQH